MVACTALAQGDASGADKAPASASGDQIEVVPIPGKHDIYMLAGAGANIVAEFGDDGVVLANAGNSQSSDQVLAAIRKLTDQPIRIIVDTSADPDVVGGNEALSAAGRGIYFTGTTPISFNGGEVIQKAATIVAATTVTLRMGSPIGQTETYPQSAWPSLSISADIYPMFVNDGGVVMYHQPARDDSDSIVEFRSGDVIAAGDAIDTDRFPVIDIKRGGSIQNEIAALNHIIDLTDSPMPFVWEAGGTYVVPGHGRLYQQFDVVQYRDMLIEIRDIVQDMIDRKMTLAQIEKASPCLSYQSQYGRDSGSWTTNDFVQAVYQSLVQQQKGGRKGRGAAQSQQG
jgi:glyoxylase-like metal-dependent hydrolase (beta-lactamase superfamily II)